MGYVKIITYYNKDITICSGLYIVIAICSYFCYYK